MSITEQIVTDKKSKVVAVQIRYAQKQLGKISPLNLTVLKKQLVTWQMIPGRRDIRN